MKLCTLESVYSLCVLVFFLNAGSQVCCRFSSSFFLIAHRTLAPNLISESTDFGLAYILQWNGGVVAFSSHTNFS